MPTLHLKSLAGKLVLATGAAIAVVMLVSNTFLIQQTRERVRNLTMTQAETEARTIANDLTGRAGELISAARSMSGVIGRAHAGDALDREGVINILKANVEHNPFAFGSWFAEEPQAFDGRRDDVRSNEALGANAAGIFTPYWSKNRTGEIGYSTFDADYEAGWYKLAASTRQGAITEPYMAQDTDIPTLMTSIAFPVTSNGTFIGVTGVDISLASLSGHLKGLQPFGTGRVALVSGSGKWMVAPSDDRLMQDYDGEGADLLKQALATSTPVAIHASGADAREAYERVVLPFDVPGVNARWAVLVDVPNSAINAIVTEQTVMMAVGGIVILAAVILALFASVRLFVGRPVDRLVADVRHLSEGNYDTAVSGQARSDEIGAVAKALEGFRHALAQSRRLEGEAAAHARAAEDERSRAEADRGEAAALQRRIVASVGEGLSALSAGRLNYRIAEDFPGEYAKLKDDFNAALASLEETIVTVNSAIDGIGNGTGEISDSVSNLSQRTEQQAASLEETAAALNQLTEQVNSSAVNARSAAKTVADACTDAEKSGEVVQKAIASMQSIEHSSSQIGQIIGVIDEIAFQTNLLALNAGVEAARAGDAGKGFAVVAQEVRELAQRSANAAKEIKALINASSMQVAEGVDLVGEAGTALQGIASQVMQISGLIQEISQSASEQAVGLKEVNAAMNQMDQVTQHNAAMVEETTAASVTLKEEAERLSQLAARFETARSAAPPALKAAAEALRAAAQRPAAPPAAAPARAPAKAARAAAATAAAADNWEEF